MLKNRKKEIILIANLSLLREYQLLRRNLCLSRGWTRGGTISPWLSSVPSSHLPFFLLLRILRPCSQLWAPQNSHTRGQDGHSTFPNWCGGSEVGREPELLGALLRFPTLIRGQACSVLNPRPGKKVWLGGRVTSQKEPGLVEKDDRITMLALPPSKDRRDEGAPPPCV